MSRIITFSTTFPSYHKRKGETTFFVEKIWNGFHGGIHSDYKTICDLNPDVDVDILWNFWKSIERSIEELKHHTIRAGHRFKIGDWFSPRIWSGIPYKSKQIIIGPDIQIKQILYFEIKKAYKELPLDYDTYIILNHRFYQPSDEIIKQLALNDGLTLPDLLQWFKYPKPFDGQVIVWSDHIKY